MKKEIISDEIIFQKVKKVVVETLGVAEEEVTPYASLKDDLGAESIDFLDINFRLERMFHIRLPVKNLLEEANEIFGEGMLEKDGVLTKLGATMMRERMGEIDSSKIREGLPIEEINSLFTIQTWVRLVREMIDITPNKCLKCGSSELLLENQVTLKCNKCDETMTFPTGDEIVHKWILEFYKRYNKSRRK